jgi:hypothetical protein
VQKNMCSCQRGCVHANDIQRQPGDI